MNDENKIPYLKETFVAFYEDALHNWKRFAAEFAADGEIAKLTDAEKLLRWMPMTNDENEGAFKGEFRTFAHRFPTGSILLSNAIIAYRHDNSRNFIDHSVLEFDEAQHRLRDEARARFGDKPDSKKG